MVFQPSVYQMVYQPSGYQMAFQPYAYQMAAQPSVYGTKPSVYGTNLTALISDEAPVVFQQVKPAVTYPSP